jgi:hypothetical protein
MDGWIDILNVSVPIFKKVEWYEMIEYTRPKAEPEIGRIIGRDREPELGLERKSVERAI